MLSAIENGKRPMMEVREWVPAERREYRVGTYPKLELQGHCRFFWIPLVTLVHASSLVTTLTHIMQEVTRCEMDKSIG